MAPRGSAGCRAGLLGGSEQHIVRDRSHVSHRRKEKMVTICWFGAVYICWSQNNSEMCHQGPFHQFSSLTWAGLEGGPL